MRMPYSNLIIVAVLSLLLLNSVIFTATSQSSLISNQIESLFVDAEGKPHFFPASINDASGKKFPTSMTVRATQTLPGQDIIEVDLAFVAKLQFPKVGPEATKVRGTGNLNGHIYYESVGQCTLRVEKTEFTGDVQAFLEKTPGRGMEMTIVTTGNLSPRDAILTITGEPSDICEAGGPMPFPIANHLQDIRDQVILPPSRGSFTNNYFNIAWEIVSVTYDSEECPPHSRLQDAPWLRHPSKGMNDNLAAADGSFQPIKYGPEENPIKYDEYSVRIQQMPQGLTPEQFLSELANNMNKAVRNKDFNDINVFDRRISPDTSVNLFTGSGGTSSISNPPPPRIGSIYDIDMKFPDNGSVMLVEQDSTHFVFQTITTPNAPFNTGRHPENGAREFGFERNSDGSVTFYTRGVSQADITLFGRDVGKYFQGVGWTAMMEGLRDQLNARVDHPVVVNPVISSSKTVDNSEASQIALQGAECR